MKTFYQQKLKMQKVKPKAPYIDIINKSSDVFYMAKLFWEECLCFQESFYVIFTDRKNAPICYAEISRGGVAATIVDFKIIFAHAFKCAACGVFLLHNHPSGNLKPSEQDKNLTLRFQRACEILDISLIDHLIITDEKYYSFRDEGLI